MNKLTKFFRNLLKNGQKLDLHYEARQSRKLPRDEAGVLVIRLDNIGDLVLWLDGARAIRARYPRPRYRITLAGSVEFRELAERSGLFDDFIAIDKVPYVWNNRYYKSILQQVAAVRATVAINPTYSRNRLSDALIYASGATTCIGLEGEPGSQTAKKKKQSNPWYTKLIAVPVGLHEIEINARFAQYFDESTQVSAPRIDPAAISYPDWLAQEKNYFVICPGTADPQKKWPLDRFAAIIDLVSQRTGWTPIVCGGPSEQQYAAAIEKITTTEIVNTCGKTSLSELIGVLKRAQLLVCSDTGAAHIASAVGCPVVIPFGGWQFGRFLPYPKFSQDSDAFINVPVCEPMPCFNCNWKCVFPKSERFPFPCVSRVTTEAVWDAVRTVIERNGFERAL